LAEFAGSAPKSGIVADSPEIAAARRWS
jgi:hypothetical protein